MNLESTEIKEISETRFVFLVKRFQKGDLSAFEELYKMYYQDLLRYLIAISKKPEIAEDITQETFITAFRKREILDDPTKFKYWLFKIGTRKFQMYLRSRKDYKLLEVEKHDENITSPSTTVIQQEEKEIVKRALSILCAEKREVLWLHIVEDVPHTEIARILNIPEGTSRSRLHSALQEMEKLIRRKIEYETR